MKCCVEQGSIKIQIEWGQAPVSVISIQRQRQTLEDDPGTWVELLYYKTKHEGGLGGPMTNGLGNKLGKEGDKMGVWITAPPIKRRRKAVETIVDKSRVEDDGTQCLTEDQQTHTAQQVFDEMVLVSTPQKTDKSSSSGKQITTQKVGCGKGNLRRWVSSASEVLLFPLHHADACMRSRPPN